METHSVQGVLKTNMYLEPDLQQSQFYNPVFLVAVFSHVLVSPLSPLMAIVCSLGQVQCLGLQEQDKKEINTSLMTSWHFMKFHSKFMEHLQFVKPILSPGGRLVLVCTFPSSSQMRFSMPSTNKPKLFEAA